MAMHSEERILANTETGDIEAGYRVARQSLFVATRYPQACDAVHPTRAEFRVDLPTRRTQVAMPSFVQRPGRQSRGQERQGR